MGDHRSGDRARLGEGSSSVIYGADTSVVLRLLTGEPTEACARATRRLLFEHQRKNTVIVTDLVIAEAYFALKHHYGAEPAAIRGMLLAMLTSGLVRAERGSAAIAILRDGAAGKAGFVDRLIDGRHREAGAVTLTLDKAQAKLRNAERIE